MVWSYPSTRGTAPVARAGHSSVVYNDKMFVWGGWGASGSNTYGELNYIELGE